jgi:predicted AAA+ superfamily ATPase
MPKIFQRYLKKSVGDDLKSKTVFIGGPRQVGKTTFALTFLPEPNEKHPAYLNWDDVVDRKSLRINSKSLQPKEFRRKSFIFFSGEV